MKTRTPPPRSQRAHTHVYTPNHVHVPQEEAASRAHGMCLPLVVVAAICSCWEAADGLGKGVGGIWRERLMRNAPPHAPSNIACMQRGAQVGQARASLPHNMPSYPRLGV